MSSLNTMLKVNMATRVASSACKPACWVLCQTQLPFGAALGAYRLQHINTAAKSLLSHRPIDEGRPWPKGAQSSPSAARRPREHHSCWASAAAAATAAQQPGHPTGGQPKCPPPHCSRILHLSIHSLHWQLHPASPCITNSSQQKNMGCLRSSFHTHTEPYTQPRQSRSAYLVPLVGDLNECQGGLQHFHL